MTTITVSSQPAHDSRLSAADLRQPLFDLLPIAVYVCDHSGAIVRFNRMAAALWGREPRLNSAEDRFCGSLRLFRLDGAALAHDGCPMADVLRTGIPVRDQEVVVERPDGTTVTVLVNIEPILDEQGAVTGAINCFRDNTAARRAMADLRAHQAQTDELLRGIGVPFYRTDAEGRVTFFNEAAAELWGTRPELGVAVWCGSWRLFWPDGRPMAHDECPMAVALRERRVVRGEEAILERPDGTRRAFIPYPTPLFAPDGTLTGAVNTLIDITDLKEASAARGQLAAIIESAQAAIVSKDLDGVVTSWNAAAERLFGYSAEEMVGRSIKRIIPVDRQHEEDLILAKVRNGQRVEPFETVRQRKDGTLIDIALTVSPVLDHTGRIVGASKIARDITERKRAAEQQRLLLRETNHRVKNLFAIGTAIIKLSARTAQSAQELADDTSRRLEALARAHTLTLRETFDSPAEGTGSTTLDSLASTILLPYETFSEGPANKQISIEGPAVTVGAGAVTHMALLLHELATNAAKYGGLSLPTGRIEISWESGSEFLSLNWRERGCSLLARPQREGFGTVLARTTAKQLGGKIDYDWAPDGLFVYLTLSLRRLRD